jgi:hypothetical protein
MGRESFLGAMIAPYRYGAQRERFVVLMIHHQSSYPGNNLDPLSKKYNR